MKFKYEQMITALNEVLKVKTDQLVKYLRREY